MPLPIILGAAAVIAATGGVGTGIHGAVKMKGAKDTMNSTERRHRMNNERFESTNKRTTEAMDELGKLELTILKSFKEFADTIEKIQNRPQFKEYNKDGLKLPKYDEESLKKVSVGAAALIGGLGGATLGTAGGVAAAGATTVAVMALGTASTGTAIASLSGAAATNATLAALGGGAIAAGGGGMALGTTILGATTLGVGLLVGGMIFSLVGSHVSDKAEDEKKVMLDTEKKINKICSYLDELYITSKKYRDTLMFVQDKYMKMFYTVSCTVNKLGKVDWNEFTQEEKVATQNAVLLVGLLYKMCQVKLVNVSDKENGLNEVNGEEVRKTISDATSVMKDIF